MSKCIITNPGTVSPGDIQFFDTIQPPLKAGDYTLSAKQTVENVTDKPGEQAPSYDAVKKLIIDGPRFVINPGHIHSVFPPANQTGNYNSFLPNIVFTDFSLPWSRPIDPVNTSDYENTPWLGLLTLHSNEFLPPASGELDKRPIKDPVTISTDQLINPGDKILPPDLGSAFQPGSEDQVTIIDIKLKFFLSIAPSIEELKYLSHSRAVNTDGKVILNMNADGCFSLCVGNRVAGKGQRNLVAMVSFEGHQNHLNGGAADTDTYDWIRLVLLGSWQYTTSTMDNEFLNMMENISDVRNGGVDLIQMPKKASTDESTTAKEALEIGYVALQNKMRAGENATSWYRGPLVPSPTKRASNLTPEEGNYGPYIYSDHAMHYDPETGIFNHAYSAAWQVGRLLALSDANFANAIFRWRASYLKSLVNQVNQKVAFEVAGRISNQETKNVNISDATLGFFAKSFSKIDWHKAVSRQDVMLGEQLPGALTAEDKQSLEEEDQDLLVFLHEKINQ